MYLREGERIHKKRESARVGKERETRFAETDDLPFQVNERFTVGGGGGEPRTKT